ncbi:MAG: DUF4062 domain-containing protein [Pseudomonadales bacterium]|nr:DUF4062 domain-containing protein [Pseudomonadales bacterium]
MSKVFVSSVVGGMEAFRGAAKQAITLMDQTPVMCEAFSARPYSSEKACIHEVEQCDVYLLILGSAYGYETPEGISVTQAEFEAAKATGKSILAFIQQTPVDDARQQAFIGEVEAYQAGVFRAGFSTELELNNEIVKALRHIDTMSQAVSEDDFKILIKQVISERRGYQDDPQLILAFLPQPERVTDIIALEQKIDDYFTRLCKGGVTQFRDGYELIDHAHWTGFSSGRSSVYFCANGLTVLTANPTQTSEGIFSRHFAPPQTLVSIAKGFRHVITANSGYVHIALCNMENTYVANSPVGSSMTMRMFSKDEEADFSRLFLPLTEGSYNEWVEQCVKRMARIFRYNSGNE